MNAERLLALYDKVAEAPDAIERLRRFVLDLAVRGKLVEQDPSDEPAPELLKRIASEKEEKVKAGVIKKQKAVPPLKKEELPFELPGRWAWTQIAELGVISPRNEADDDSEASFVPMPMISEKYGVANDHESRSWREIKKGYTHFAEGDVGLAKITPCFENGKSTVFRNLTGGIGAGTTELHIVRPILVDADFILLFLKTAHFIETGIPRMTGTAGQKRVPKDYFTSSPFPLPPLGEQRRILTKVEELMALLDRLEAARTERETTRDRLTTAGLARLTAPDTAPEEFPNQARFALGALPALTARPDQINFLRQTVLNLAIRGKLVEQDLADEPASDLLKRIEEEKGRLISAGKFKTFEGTLDRGPNAFTFSIPLNWSWCYLDDVAAIARGGSPRPIKSFITDDPDGIPWIKIGDSNRGSIYIDETRERIKPEGMAKSRLVIAGDLLLSNSMSFGFPYITNVEGCIHDGWLVIRTPDGLIDKLYLHKVFLSDHATAAFSKAASGAVVQNLNADKVRQLPFPLPPLSEQRRIVARAEELMALLDRLEAALAQADTTRAHLLETLLNESLGALSSKRAAA